MLSMCHVLCVLVLMSCVVSISLPTHQNDETQSHLLSVIDDHKVLVPVTLGVMSRCPDALLCETVFDKVLDRVHEKVDIQLAFIGNINASEPEYGVTCKHGPGECAGNTHELCAIAHTNSSFIWWPFLTCLNYEGTSHIGTEQTSKHCAGLASIDWENSGLKECIRGEEGRRLLKWSVKHTQSLGIQKSCTIVINHRIRCVHDSNWEECDEGHEPSDFIRTINEDFDKLNPE